MTEDSKNNEQTYTTTEAAERLGISIATVRKYAKHLEEKGYHFMKSDGPGQRQARLFLEKDIAILEKLKNTRESENITVEQATTVVMDELASKEINDVKEQEMVKQQTQDEIPDVYYDALSSMQKELKEQNEKQQEMIEQLSRQLEIRDRYIIGKLKESEDYITKMLEMKQQPMETIEEANTENSSLSDSESEEAPQDKEETEKKEDAENSIEDLPPRVRKKGFFKRLFNL